MRSKNAFISVDHRWKLLLRSQLTVFRKMQKENLRVKTETEELYDLCNFFNNFVHLQIENEAV